MKVVITHLKAPWPAGAKPGDVCELPHAEVPGWALGKCTPAEADAEATLVFNIEPAAPVADAAPAAGTDPLADAEAQAKAERAASKKTRAAEAG